MRVRRCHRWEPTDWWEVNAGFSPQGWRLLCDLEQCDSPRHWAAGDFVGARWTVGAFCTFDSRPAWAVADVRHRLGLSPEPRSFKPTEPAFTRSLAREIAEPSNGNLLPDLTSAICATTDLLWREYRFQKGTLSVLGSVSDWVEEWWFGLLLKADQRGRLEFAVACTSDEYNRIVGLVRSETHESDHLVLHS